MHSSLLFQYIFIALRTVQREYAVRAMSHARIYTVVLQFTIPSYQNIFIIPAKSGLFRDMSDFVAYL